MWTQSTSTHFKSSHFDIIGTGMRSVKLSEPQLKFHWSDRWNHKSWYLTISVTMGVCLNTTCMEWTAHCSTWTETLLEMCHTSEYTVDYLIQSRIVVRWVSVQRHFNWRSVSVLLIRVSSSNPETSSSLYSGNEWNQRRAGAGTHWHYRMLQKRFDVMRNIYDFCQMGYDVAVS